MLAYFIHAVRWRFEACLSALHWCIAQIDRLIVILSWRRRRGASLAACARLLARWVLGALAIGWWGAIAFLRIVWACRASALCVAVGFGLIVMTDQARDIVIASGVPSEQSWRVPAAVFIWATLAWYWARITMSYRFVVAWIERQSPAQQAWCEFWRIRVPRLLGTLAVLSVALAFRSAAKTYAAALDSGNAAAFQERAQLYYVFAVLFYAAVALRQPIMLWLTERLPTPTRMAATLTPTRETVGELGGFHNPLVTTFFLTTSIAAPIVAIAVAIDPVRMNELFGGAVPGVLLGLALIVPLTSVLVILSARLRLPLFAAVVLWIAMAPQWLGDIHNVRTCRDLELMGARNPCAIREEVHDTRLSLKEAFHKWWQANSKLTPPLGEVVAPPMIVVATAGGASRAAYWTSQVLGNIAAREPFFAERVFMISGVSGGSLGATTFRALIEAQRRSNGGGDVRLMPQAASDGGSFLKKDFLGPALSTGLYVDLLASGYSYFLPERLQPDDRAVALEKAWEAAWEITALGKGKFGWADGFNATFTGSRPWPLLALNGTSVEKGKRLLTSNVRLWTGTAENGTNLSGGINRYDAFETLKSDIPISTAVTMSARFPAISPTGALRDEAGVTWGRVTDGGLFENFGAVTADEVIRYLVFRLGEVQRGPYQTIPIAILISSDPSLDQLHLRRDGVANVAPPDCTPTNGESRSYPTLHPGNGWKECPVEVHDYSQLLGDPIRALYDGRVARGEAAATALLDRITDSRIPVRDRLIERSKLPFDEVQARFGLDDHNDFFHFRQCRVDGMKTPTMSWHDSQYAWDAMKQMLGLEKDATGKILDHCGNQAEFFRLCVRLARLTTKNVDDIEATRVCEERGWPKPMGWDCDSRAHDGKRPFCGLTRKGQVVSRAASGSGN